MPNTNPEQFTLWILDVLKTIVPVLLTWFFMKKNTNADTATKWADLADQATDQLIECRESYARLERKTNRLEQKLKRRK